MVFSSITFLFLFLPFVLLLYFIWDNLKYRNFLLLVASLFFYTWGEHIMVLLMIFSIIFNYTIGIFLGYERINKHIIVSIGVLGNILLLAYFKYFNFFIGNISTLFGLESNVEKVHLPIGISFFTFQSISYLVDVYRSQAKVQRNPMNLALYISFFPQLIAGPIVRYTTVANELVKRTVSSANFYSGVIRFIEGLAKKVLIANPMGYLASEIMVANPTQVNFGIAWFGLLAYSIQIYFDFSGYSDMAIGLGRMFGFHFLENFNFPYISRSIQEFWRRWHISLSSWFRDYVYIPLGGNRLGAMRTYINLISVFFLTGLWHGASWNFIIWGLYHGFFIVMEKLWLKKWLNKFEWLSHAYTILVVMVGWIFFKLETLNDSILFFKAITNFKVNPQFLTISDIFTMKVALILFFGIVISIGVFKRIKYYILVKINRNKSIGTTRVYQAFLFFGYLTVFLMTITSLASSTYNPFIYFRF